MSEGLIALGAFVSAALLVYKISTDQFLRTHEKCKRCSGTGTILIDNGWYGGCPFCTNGWVKK